MSPIVLVLYATFLINVLLSAVGAMIGVLALYRAANAYEFAGKRPKNTWLALTGVPAAVQVLGVFSAFTGAGNTMLMLQLMAAVVSGVFLAGVWPVVGGRRF